MFFILTALPEGRMLGFDMQLIYSWLIQLFNTAVLCYFLAKILYNPVKQFLHNRSEGIAKSLEEADNALLEAQKTKEWYDEKMKAVEFERNEILDLAKQRGIEMENKIIAEAEAEAKLIKERAMLDIKREQENSLDEMKKQIIDLSTTVAERYIVAKIDQDTQNKLLDQVISDLGDATWLN